MSKSGSSGGSGGSGVWVHLHPLFPLSDCICQLFANLTLQCDQAQGGTIGIGEVCVIRTALTTSRDGAPAGTWHAPLDMRVTSVGSRWMRRARCPPTWDSES